MDYLEETRLRYWGRRDGYVWYFGVFGVVGQLFSLSTSGVPRDSLTLLNQTLWTVVAIAYLLLYRPARMGLLVAGLTGLAVTVWQAVRGSLPLTAAQAKQLGGSSGVAVVIVGSGVLGLLFVIAAYRSPRNKLAFKIEIDEHDLRRVYDTYRSNPLAMRAAWYGAVSMMLPFASAITLAMGIRALRRVSPNGWPPRGGRVPALIGIVLSALALCGWSALFLTMFMARRP
jgi:hypothetical protein